MSRYPTIRATTLASALVLSSPFTAQAQVAPEPTETPELPGDEILVTATRRPERAIDVPIAVSTLSGEKLAVLNSGGQDIRFLSGRTPSLLIESSFGRTFPRVFIRGLGNPSANSQAAQPVSIVYDNIALESPYLKAFPVFDVANVEVLKGPQGTLFGRNTPAGVLKMTSARPTDSFDGHASVSWGTYNTVNSEVAIGGPLTDKISIRLSGMLQRRDDWVTNDYAGTVHERSFEGYQDVAGRAQIAYTDGPLDILLNLHGRTLSGTARLFRSSIIQPGTNRLVDAFDVEHAFQDGSNPQSLDSWGANAQVSYAFDGLGTLFSVTGWEGGNVYSRGDIDGGAIYTPAAIPSTTPGVARSVSETGSAHSPREFTQEVRFASEKFGPVSFQLGGYYFNQNLESGGPTSGSWVPSGAFTVGSSAHLDNRTYAAFGSLEVTPSDALILRGGLRWSHDERWSKLVPGADINATTRQVIGSTSGSKLSWDASATYKLSRNASVYARIANGYLGATILNDVNAGISTKVTPQTTTSYEVGFKTDLPGLLNLAVDGYYFDTRDIQLTAVGGGSNVTRLLNAKRAIGYGVEAELTATPLENLILTFGGSYNHTELQDPDLYVAPCGGGCTVTDPIVSIGGANRASIDGNALPQAPRWIASWTARYAVPVGSDSEVFVFTDWAYRSKVNLFLYESIEFTGAPMLEGGLRLGYRNHAQKWEVAAFARNLTNQIRIVGAIDFNNLTGMVNEPRILGGEVRFAF